MTQSRFPIFAALFLAGALLLSPFASAKDRLLDSFEWATIDAELIVRAKVIAVQEESRQFDYHIRWHKIDLQIIETIKGPQSTRLDVAEWCDPRGFGYGITRACDFESALDSKGEMLVFLDRRERFGTGPGMPGDCKWVVRKQGGWYVTHNSSEAVALDTDAWVSLTGDSVSGPEMLKQVRQVAAWAQSAGQVTHRAVDSYVYPFKATDEEGVIIPLAEPFFQQMRDYAANNNEKNQNYGYTTLPPWNEWTFRERSRMYRELRALNIPADRPPIDAPAEIHEPAGRTLIGAALILLAWPIGWIFARRKTGERFRFASMLAIWRLTLAAALTAAWLLSYRQGASIVWQHAGARWQLASFAGVLRLARVVDDPHTHSPKPVGIVGALFWLDPDDAADWNLREVTLTDAWEKWGVSIGNGTPLAPTPNRSAAWVMRNFAPPQPKLWVAIIPWLWPVCTLGPLALVLGISQFRKCRAHRTRQRQGFCTHCGYDLRATPHRCPECGIPVKSV